MSDFKKLVEFINGIQPKEGTIDKKTKGVVEDDSPQLPSFVNKGYKGPCIIYEVDFRK